MFNIYDQLGYLLLHENITYYSEYTADTVPLGIKIMKRTPTFNLRLLYNLQVLNMRPLGPTV